MYCRKEDGEVILPFLYMRDLYMDLKRSPHKIQSKNGILFYFSSKKRCSKFCDMIADFCRDEAHKMSNRYKIYIDFTILYEIMLYMQIEKYGFYIEYKGDAFTCPTQVKLDGEKLTKLS